MKQLTKIFISVIGISTLCFTHQSIANSTFPTTKQHIVSTVNKDSSNHELDISELLKDNLYVGVKNPHTGVISYVHSGKFYHAEDGYYYQNGNRLQGYTVPEKLIKNNCKLEDVKISSEAMSAKSTNLINLSLNLNAGDSPINLPFDPNNLATYNYNAMASMNDGLGVYHQSNLYFIKTDSDKNTWDVRVYVDGVNIAVGKIAFNIDGTLSSTTGLNNLKFVPSNGASEMFFNINLMGTTQFASPYITRYASHDGYPAGEVLGESVDGNGYIAAYYTNGQTRVFAKLAIVEAH